MGNELLGRTQFEQKDIPVDIKDLRSQELNILLKNSNLLIGLRDSLAPAKARADIYVEQARKNKELVEEIEQIKASQSEFEQEIVDLKNQEAESFAKWQQVESTMYIKSRPYTSLGVEDLLGKKIRDCQSRKQELTVKIFKNSTSRRDIAGLVRTYADTVSDLYCYESISSSI